MAKLLTVVDAATAYAALAASAEQTTRPPRAPKAPKVRTPRATGGASSRPLPPAARKPAINALDASRALANEDFHGPGGSIIESTPMQPDGRLLLTVKEAAQRLAISESLCWRLVIREELPSIIIGARARRIPVAALTAFINAKVASGGF